MLAQQHAELVSIITDQPIQVDRLPRTWDDLVEKPGQVGDSPKLMTFEEIDQRMGWNNTQPQPAPLRLMTFDEIDQRLSGEVED